VLPALNREIANEGTFISRILSGALAGRGRLVAPSGCP